jgi:hypothetical protein
MGSKQQHTPTLVSGASSCAERGRCSRIGADLVDHGIHDHHADSQQFWLMVTVSPDGKSYAGTFTLDAYDTTGHVATSLTGAIAGTRITVNTTVGDLL